MTKKICKIIVFTVLPMIFLLMSCAIKSNTSAIKKEDVTQVKFTLSIVDASNINKLTVLRDSQFILYYKDYVIYRFPTWTQYSDNLFDAHGNLIDSTIRIEPDIQSFIFKSGSLYGFYYDSLRDVQSTKHPIDSFINSRLTINPNMILSPNDSLIQIIEHPNNIRQEIYLRTKKNQALDCDTNNLYFSTSMHQIKFSISPFLDSLKKSKLFKIHQISNNTKVNINDINSKKIESSIEISPDLQIDLQYVSRILELYKSTLKLN